MGLFDSLTVRSNSQDIEASWFNSIRTLLNSVFDAYNLDDITDVTIATPLDKQVLTYETSSGLWKNVSTVLNDIDDVVITSVANNQVLTYNSGSGDWVNQAAAAGDKTVQSKTAAYTMLTSDDVGLGNTTSGGFSFTLPTAVGNEGKVFDFKHTGTSYSNFLTLDGDGTETIDGATTYVLRIPNSGVRLVSDNANWRILEEYRPPNRIEERILASDQTTDNTVISAWTFANLITDTWYHVTGVATLMLDVGTNNDDVYIEADHNSSTIARMRWRVVQATDTSADTLTLHMSFKFKAAASTLTFTTRSSNSSSYMAGGGTKTESYVQLEELSRTETTTDF